eukprot:951372-Pyramimonas_sp.AAC.1
MPHIDLDGGPCPAELLCELGQYIFMSRERVHARDGSAAVQAAHCIVKIGEPLEQNFELLCLNVDHVTPGRLSEEFRRIAGGAAASYFA